MGEGKGPGDMAGTEPASDADDAGAVLSRLACEVRNGHRWSVVGIAAGIPLLAFCLVGLIWRFHGTRAWWNSTDLGLVGLAGLMFAQGVAVGAARRAERQGDELSRAQGHVDLSALIDIVTYMKRGTRSPFGAACAGHMNRATDTECADLDEARRAKLRGLLPVGIRPFWDVAPDVTAAALRVLAASGDLHALPIAERLAERCEQPTIRAAAAAAAAKLRALRAGGTLLRPTDGSAEELLRPADRAGEQELLLRASDGGDADHDGQ